MKRLIVITVALALGASFVSAQTATNAPPNRMSYQGYLVDANGNPLAPSTPVNYPVTFRIHTSATSNTRIWSESQIVTVDKGNFSAVLGEGSPVPGESSPPLSEVIANRADASDRFIGITVRINNVDTDILPRLRLLPTPYAFLATSARNLTAPNGSTVVTYTNNRVEIAGGIQSSGMGVIQNNVLEFGIGVPGKESNAGKIGYRTFSSDALDIVGAGTSGTDRKVRFFAEGGTTFSGPVGIANPSPQRLLHIGSGTAGSEGMIRLQSSSSLGGAARAWDMGVPETDNDTSGLGYSFIIDDTTRAGNDFIVRWDSGNVGLGTITPSAKLDVNGSIAMGNTDLLLARNNANVLENVFWPRWSDNVTYLNYGSGGFNIRNNASTSRMFLQDNGNVGVGTTTPANTFQIKAPFHAAAGYALSVNNADFGANIQINRGAGGAGLGLVVDNSGNGDASTHLLLVRNNVVGGPLNLFDVRADGRVGIGTTAPSAPLSFGTTLGNTKLALWDSGPTSMYGLGIQNSQFRLHVGSASDRFSFLNGPAGTEVATITGNGYVGIGTNSPQRSLHIYAPGDPAIMISDPSHTWYIYDYTPLGELTFQHQSGNWFAVRPNGTTTSTSDARLKKDVKALENVLDRALRLRPVTYRMKSETNSTTKHLGFLAQEVEPLFPEAVSEARGFKGISYTDLIPVAIGAIQELHQITQKKDSELNALRAKAAHVDRLEQEVDDLKKQLRGGEGLEARIRALEKAMAATAQASSKH